MFWERRKIWNGVLGVYSLALFVIFPKSFDWKVFLVALVCVGFLTFWRLTHPGRRSLVSNLSWIGVYTLGVIVALTTSLFRLTDDKKIAKVILTGKSEDVWVSWKNPSHENLQGAWLKSYEVVLQDLKGNEVCRKFVYGDTVGLRAEVVHLAKPFHWLGFSNLYRLQTVYNGYSTSSRHNQFPHEGSSLPWSYLPLWEKLYMQNWKIPGVRSATLESVHLPLSRSGSYWLIVGQTGITAAPVDL